MGGDRAAQPPRGAAGGGLRRRRSRRCRAVLWPVQPDADDAALQAAVDAANATLPDYARIARWTRGRAAFDARSRPGHGQRPAAARRHPATPCRCARPGPRTHSLNPTHELPRPTAATKRRRPPGPAGHADHPGLPARRGLAAQLRGLPARGLPPRAPHRAAAAGDARPRCRARHAWLRGPLDEYIEEEAGHDEWILDDIARLRRRCRSGAPRPARPCHRGDGGLCLRHHRARQPARLLRHGACARRHQRVAGADGGRRDPDAAARCPMRPSATCARTARSTASTPRTSRC